MRSAHASPTCCATTSPATRSTSRRRGSSARCASRPTSPTPSAARVAVRTAAEIDGRKRFRGEVVEAGERAFTVRTADDTAFTIPYEAIVRSNLIDEG